uniref:Reverse transcriptase n=1 Tax=Glyptapanteles indiensis TaxID=92994 RepID=B7S988_GLYIN|nr:reverse transcriptase [Glyptapanteles indiensis]
MKPGALNQYPIMKKPIGCKWVFKIKRDSGGNPQRYKARLVAQGFSQRSAIDYDEVFAPVVKHTTFHTLLSIAEKWKLLLKHRDAKTAFLNSELTETIYMRQLPGFVREERPDWACKLNKTIYSLKQSAKVWYDKLKTVLNNLRFKVCDNDPCLFKTIDNNPIIYIVAHIDDMVVAFESIKRILALKAAINKQFTIVYLRNLKLYLGIAKLIGTLLYAAVNTGPDISAAISILSQHIKDTKQIDWLELKRVCSYLKYSQNYELRSNNSNSQSKLVGFADASWAECRDDRESNTGCFPTI